MFNPIANVLTFFRARWRWVRGYCPHCNRRLYATFGNHVADCPRCPACQEETETNLRMGLWGELADFEAEADPVSDPAVRPVGAGQAPPGLPAVERLEQQVQQ